MITLKFNSAWLQIGILASARKFTFGADNKPVAYTDIMFETGVERSQFATIYYFGIFRNVIRLIRFHKTPQLMPWPNVHTIKRRPMPIFKHLKPREVKTKVLKFKKNPKNLDS